MLLCVWCLAAAAPSTQVVAQTSPEVAAVPADFPQFVVPGYEREMAHLRELFWLHYEPAGPLIPLWDEWMPMSTLWPAHGPEVGLQTMRTRWASAFAGRMLNSEGYVHTQQHNGPAHAEGWPFPLWTQAGGVGWHFAPLGVPGYEAPLCTPADWKLEGVQAGPASDRGWVIELTAPHATAQSPPFSINAAIAPWLRLNWWARGLDDANGFVEWTTAEHPEFGSERRVDFSPVTGLRRVPDSSSGASPEGRLELAPVETRTMICVSRLPGWTGTITGLRIHFGNSGPAEVVIKSFHTASDSRHNINNSNFIRGCHDYFMWTHDLLFLRNQVDRIRTAMRFIMREFRTRERNCIYTTWPGHEGRSGVRYVNGQKVIVPGEGIGSNYWDLLPFGGEDALATIYYFDALRDLAELEELIAVHPEWNVSHDAAAFDPADLRRHAEQVRDYGRQRFWNEQTGRFGTIDLDGNLHDYGFTFLNNEAVYYGFATPQQEQAIHAWLSGQRLVAGDTSVGDDIYHWRFGPRSTTRRNLDYYFWGWSNPESIPWGLQVQDGGAVLGFSYHDLMARLKTAGADDAWQRLQQIANWFEEVQSAGGYREYYRDPSRGTLQGGNVPGGLGMDREFFESILVPQVMLYGFLGFSPTCDGFVVEPQLPKAWSELTITRIHLHDHVLDIRVTADTVDVRQHQIGSRPLVIKSTPAHRVSVHPVRRQHADPVRRRQTITYRFPHGVARH